MNKSEEFWDKQANKYDKSEKRFDPAFKKILHKTKHYLKSSDIALDYGCATGEKSFELAATVKTLYGMDISSKMIQEAQKKANLRKIRNVVFSQGTIFDNEFKNGSFDVIIAYGILHLLEDYEKVVQKIHELLKPEGLFISTTACLKDKMTFRSKFEFSLYLFIKKIGLFPLFLNMLTCAETEDIITSGDFNILESEDIFHGISMCFIAAKKNEKK